VVVAKGVSFVTENYANYVTGEKPLLPSGALTNVVEGGRPSSAKLQTELGWQPTSFDRGKLEAGKSDSSFRNQEDNQIYESWQLHCLRNLA
jgi:hypothetical protein